MGRRWKWAVLQGDNPQCTLEDCSGKKGELNEYEAIALIQRISVKTLKSMIDILKTAVPNTTVRTQEWQSQVVLCGGLCPTSVTLKIINVQLHPIVFKLFDFILLTVLQLGINKLFMDGRAEFEVRVMMVLGCSLRCWRGNKSKLKGSWFVWACRWFNRTKISEKIADKLMFQKERELTRPFLRYPEGTAGLKPFGACFFASGFLWNTRNKLRWEKENYRFLCKSNNCQWWTHVLLLFLRTDNILEYWDPLRAISETHKWFHFAHEDCIYMLSKEVIAYHFSVCPTNIKKQGNGVEMLN